MNKEEVIRYEKRVFYTKCYLKHGYTELHAMLNAFAVEQVKHGYLEDESALCFDILNELMTDIAHARKEYRELESFVSESYLEDCK